VDIVRREDMLEAGVAHSASDPKDQPPLRPVVFELLLTLGDGAMHGYAIMQLVNERMGRRVIVGPGTLYRTLKELRELGWIEQARRPADEDARRQYYKLTEDGRRAAAGEATRMAELVDLARSGGLLPGGGAS
jgi:DNA-binding PadR family transcriptional regulator